MPRRAPIIALLTDFGLSDHFVGVLKSVLLDRIPSARIIDITHGIEPGRIRQGAFALWSSAPYLPKGSVVLAVVDPGVGTDRRIHMMKTPNQTWIAPDNGLLDMVRGETPDAKCFVPKESALKQICRIDTSTTFHGRDIFAPLAAAIAGGTRLTHVGRSVVVGPPVPWQASAANPVVTPEIISVDRFGNIITNIIVPPGKEPRDVLRSVGVGNIMVSHSIRTYSEAPENTPSLIRGSTGLLEVVVRNASASTLLRAHDRTLLRVVWL